MTAQEIGTLSLHSRLSMLKELRLARMAANEWVVATLGKRMSTTYNPVTRASRAVSGRERIETDYDGKLATFLEFVLDAYVSEGIGELDRKKLSDLLELKYGFATEWAAELGGPAVVAKAFVGFQRHLFQE